MSPLSKITNPEITIQLKLVKGSSSNRVNDLLLKKQNQLPYLTVCLYFVLQAKYLIKRRSFEIDN